MSASKTTVTVVSPYQFGMLPFQQPIYDRWASTGIKSKMHKSIARFLHYPIYHGNVSFKLPFWRTGNDAKLMFVSGTHPDIMLFPYTYTNEIIPIIWDCWPDYVPSVKRIFDKCLIKVAFFTSQQTAELFKSLYPQKNIYFLPEAINTTLYYQGKCLNERTIDILEYGRSNAEVHTQLLEVSNINHVYSKNGEHLFKDFTDLSLSISESKIVICYPRSVMEPNLAKGIETLTQRYWECMYSGALIVGKAPKELIDIAGYNPVIEAGVENIKDVVTSVLSNPQHYQRLADDNRLLAMENGDWINRLDFIKDVLHGLDYSI